MKKYDVFISYSRKDSEIAFKICKILEDAELKVFIDIKDIPPTEFPDVIASAILSSKIFLLLASKNYYEGRYSPDEFQCFHNRVCLSSQLFFSDERHCRYKDGKACQGKDRGGDPFHSCRFYFRKLGIIFHKYNGEG